MTFIVEKYKIYGKSCTSILARCCIKKEERNEGRKKVRKERDARDIIRDYYSKRNSAFTQRCLCRKEQQETGMRDFTERGSCLAEKYV